MKRNFIIQQFLYTGCPHKFAIFSEHVTGIKPHQTVLISDSFSYQTWTIFLPKRNLCPTRPPKVKNKKKVFSLRTVLETLETHQEFSEHDLYPKFLRIWPIF